MKVITKTVIDMRTGAVLAEESFEHDGDVALAGGKSMPKAEAAPPAPEPSKSPDSEIQKTRDDAKTKAQQAAGLAGTNKTGAGLTEPASTQKKSLLGQ